MLFRTVLFFLCFTALVLSQSQDWFLPILHENRDSWHSVKLTPIGQFGVWRKARPTVPAHYHTGVDLVRPNGNYENEPVFSAAAGRVISLRDDGPYAQVIIEHQLEEGNSVWTVYEHITGIRVNVGDTVDANDQIARFFNKEELDRYGWQFDHIHFEILKKRPRRIKPVGKTPFRFFTTYSLECYTKEVLDSCYYHPKRFLESKWY